jgi:hypothetical protein
MELLKENAEIKSISMYPAIDKKLNEIAKKYNTSRSKVIEYLILTNYENLMKDKKEV